MQKVKEVLRKLDEAGIRLKLEKCIFAQEQREWFGFTLSKNGIKPIDDKIQAITNKLKQKNLEELR